MQPPRHLRRQQWHEASGSRSSDPFAALARARALGHCPGRPRVVAHGHRWAAAAHDAPRLPAATLYPEEIGEEGDDEVVVEEEGAHAHEQREDRQPRHRATAAGTLAQQHEVGMVAPCGVRRSQDARLRCAKGGVADGVPAARRVRVARVPYANPSARLDDAATHLN